MDPIDQSEPISPNGFVLLEVLVAMTLIMGCWFSSLEAFQRLVLRFSQQEAKKVQLRKAFDAYELAEQFRANGNGVGAYSNASFSSDTYQYAWLKSKLSRAQSLHKSVVVVMHHHPHHRRITIRCIIIILLIIIIAPQYQVSLAI